MSEAKARGGYCRSRLCGAKPLPPTLPPRGQSDNLRFTATAATEFRKASFFQHSHERNHHAQIISQASRARDARVDGVAFRILDGRPPGNRCPGRTRAQASSSTALSGALTGTFSAGRVLGLPSTFNAKGTINPLGKAAATGTLQRHFAPLGGTMTVVTRYGKIYMNLSLPSVDGNTYRIKITGGTGMYLGASGGGSGDIWLVAKGDEGLGGSFTFTFTATMVP